MLIYLWENEARDEKEFSETIVNGTNYIQYDKMGLNNGIMQLISISEWDNILNNQEKYKDRFEKYQIKENDYKVRQELKELNNIEYNKFYGFFNNKTKLNAGKIKKALEVKYLYTEFNLILTRKEHIEKLYSSKEYSHAEEKELYNINSEWRKVLTTTSECDYFNYLKENDIKVNLDLKFIED